MLLRCVDHIELVVELDRIRVGPLRSGLQGLAVAIADFPHIRECLLSGSAYCNHKQIAVLATGKVAQEIALARAEQAGVDFGRGHGEIVFARVRPGAAVIVAEEDQRVALLLPHQGHDFLAFDKDCGFRAADVFSISELPRGQQPYQTPRLCQVLPAADCDGGNRWLLAGLVGHAPGHDEIAVRQALRSAIGKEGTGDKSPAGPDIGFLVQDERLALMDQVRPALHVRDESVEHASMREEDHRDVHDSLVLTVAGDDLNF